MDVGAAVQSFAGSIPFGDSNFDKEPLRQTLPPLKNLDKIREVEEGQFQPEYFTHRSSTPVRRNSESHESIHTPQKKRSLEKGSSFISAGGVSLEDPLNISYAQHIAEEFAKFAEDQENQMNQMEKENTGRVRMGMQHVS